MARKKLFPLIMIVLAGFLITGGTADASNVLMVNISGGYNGDAANIFTTLVNAGATGTYVNLTADGQAATALGADIFDQVWVFDLSTGADNYPSDYAAIAAWYNNRPSNEIICDSRMISSYWSGRYATEGQALTENYYYNMDIRGGGLLLGTDHDAYQGGINQINSQIGIDPFFGTFNLSTIPVDTANPLMNTPNNMGTVLYDDSSPGQTPYGLQPNGRILYTVAWHSNNPDTPGISATIEGAVGMHVDITSPPDGSEFDVTETIVFTAEATGGDAPYTYEWFANGITPIGYGQTNPIPAGMFALGPVTITVLARDSADREDDDSIVITISLPNVAPECDAGGPYFGTAGVPVLFDGSASGDTDGEIVSWEWDFGDGNTGTGEMAEHTYAEDGDYLVTLCVTDDDGEVSCCAPELPVVPTETTSWGGLKAIYR